MSDQPLPPLLSAAERARFGPFALELADTARAITLQYFARGIAVEAKALKHGAFDPVTRADREAEAAIRGLIETHFPDHGIRGEEYGIKPGHSDFAWVLDPIDGTRAYISALASWGTLIALTRHDRPVLGLMDLPVLGERFVGFGDAAQLHKDGQSARALQVRACSALAEATISTTDPYLFRGAEKPAFEAIRAASRLQRYGLDCAAYGALARGGLDLVIESGLEDYDIAALIPMVEGAGGQVTNWSGGPAWQGGQVLASGDARLHSQALEILAKSGA